MIPIKFWNPFFLSGPNKKELSRGSFSVRQGCYHLITSCFYSEILILNWLIRVSVSLKWCWTALAYFFFIGGCAHRSLVKTPTEVLDTRRLISNRDTGVFRRFFFKRACLSWLWRSECQMYCWVQCSLAFFVFLGVTLDCAETPFAKAPFSWFLNWDYRNTSFWAGLFQIR